MEILCIHTWPHDHCVMYMHTVLNHRVFVLPISWYSRGSLSCDMRDAEEVAKKCVCVCVHVCACACDMKYKKSDLAWGKSPHCWGPVATLLRQVATLLRQVAWCHALGFLPRLDSWVLAWLVSCIVFVDNPIFAKLFGFWSNDMSVV